MSSSKQQEVEPSMGGYPGSLRGEDDPFRPEHDKIRGDPERYQGASSGSKNGVPVVPDLNDQSKEISYENDDNPTQPPHRQREEEDGNQIAT